MISPKSERDPIAEDRINLYFHARRKEQDRHPSVRRHCQPRKPQNFWFIPRKGAIQVGATPISSLRSEIIAENFREDAPD